MTITKKVQLQFYEEKLFQTLKKCSLKPVLNKNFEFWIKISLKPIQKHSFTALWLQQLTCRSKHAGKQIFGFLSAVL